MRTFTSLLILQLIQVSFLFPAFAHQPSDLELKYFPDSKTLQVVCHHHVEEPFRHYVDLIEVRRNNGAPLRYHLRGQDSSGLVMKEIRLPADMGDTVSVRAQCHTGGEIQGLIRLDSASYYGDGAYFRSHYERPDRRGLYRTLDDFRYHRYRDHLIYDGVIIIQPRPDPAVPSEPYDPVDSPKRRQLQKEEEIRRDFHKRLEGGDNF